MAVTVGGTENKMVLHHAVEIGVLRYISMCQDIGKTQCGCDIGLSGVACADDGGSECPMSICWLMYIKLPLKYYHSILQSLKMLTFPKVGT